MLDLTKKRANTVRPSSLDVLNLYAPLVMLEWQDFNFYKIALENGIQLFKLSVQTTGTLVAKEQSEQEGYKE